MVFSPIPKILCCIAVFAALVSHFISCAPVENNKEQVKTQGSDSFAKGLIPDFTTEIYPRDDDEDETTVAGPGAQGILAGLNGIFANIVSGNLNKLVESTFNFVPPVYQGNVKGVYSSLLGKAPPIVTTEAAAKATEAAGDEETK